MFISDFFHIIYSHYFFPFHTNQYRSADTGGTCLKHFLENSWVHKGRGQTDTDNPAEYGYIRNRIVPLGMKRISIWTIRYSFDTLRNRSIENPVPFYPLRNTYKNYPFQTDNQTDNKLPRRAKSLKDDIAKKTLSKPKFSLRKCSLWESMSSNDPRLNPFLGPVENRSVRLLT